MDEPTWKVSGVVDRVNSGRGTIRVWVEGMDHLQVVPIDPLMPEWMLREGSAFRTTIPYQVARAHTLKGVRWGPFSRQPYTQLSEEDLLWQMSLLNAPITAVVRREMRVRAMRKGARTHKRRTWVRGWGPHRPPTRPTCASHLSSNRLSSAYSSGISPSAPRGRPSLRYWPGARAEEVRDPERGREGDEALASVVAAVIEAHPKAVADYRAGKGAAINRLLGEVRRAAPGYSAEAALEALRGRL
jgi:hypothetical protein